MSDFNAEVCRALRDYMTDHGISQQVVATRLGRSQSYVSQRTTGRYVLGLDIIEAVATEAHTPARDLLAVLARTER